MYPQYMVVLYCTSMFGSQLNDRPWMLKHGSMDGSRMNGFTVSYIKDEIMNKWMEMDELKNIFKSWMNLIIMVK